MPQCPLSDRDLNWVKEGDRQIEERKYVETERERERETERERESGIESKMRKNENLYMYWRELLNIIGKT